MTEPTEAAGPLVPVVLRSVAVPVSQQDNAANNEQIGAYDADIVS